MTVLQTITAACVAHVGRISGNVTATLDIAWDIMKKEGIPVMDTYRLTL
jgi:hypothetical protein